MENKLSHNLIAFFTGLIVFATDLFTQIPTLDRTSISLFGGYLFLSIYHGWKFAAPKVSNLTSIVVFWLFPIVLVFTAIWALLVGFVISVPKFLASFVHWRSTRHKSPAGVSQTGQNIIDITSADSKKRPQKS